MRFLPARVIGIFLVGFLLLFFSLPQASAQTVDDSDPITSKWDEDPEVTEVGKGIVRARDFLNWTLSTDNANWVFLSQETGGLNQVAQFWELIRNIAYGLTVLIVLITAFVIIITRGKSINVRKQLLLIAAVFLLITFSFSIIDFLYRFIDTLQNYFLKLPNSDGTSISSKDLLNVGFKYGDFTGYKEQDANEAANTGIFLVKATSITYYAMAGILLLRKIILWFFIMLSPLWVLLLPFQLVRGTAKVWLGEFFRWLFYAPIFAVLLAGLTKMWKSQIPLSGVSNPSDYPAGISILLGGPGQSVGITNNINVFATYVFALLMLWVVILLPFLLLKIFRDTFVKLFKDDNEFMQKTFGSLYPFLGRQGAPTPAPIPPAGEGLAREMSLRRPPVDSINARNVVINAQVANIDALPQAKTTDIVKYAGLSVPNLRDLARLEMDQQSLSQHQTALRNIASPTAISSIHERSRFSSIQQELLSRSRKGDAAASTILAAAESAKTNRPVPIVVGTRAVAGKPDVPVTGKPTMIPTINRMQTVAVEDYEDVKKMWEENYRAGDVPISDKVKSREAWISQDAKKMQSVIELIGSGDEERKKQGLEELAVVLPFLLLGGFSDQETTVYLKAKLEAAKKVLIELEKKEGLEDKVEIEAKKEDKNTKTMEAKAEKT